MKRKSNVFFFIKLSLMEFLSNFIKTRPTARKSEAILFYQMVLSTWAKLD